MKVTGLTIEQVIKMLSDLVENDKLWLTAKTNITGYCGSLENFNFTITEENTNDNR